MQVEAGWAVEQGAPVGPQLYRVLRQRIVRNDFHPGMRISEAEVAAAFAVSRQPVREAFIKLAEEGLVEVRPQRGTFIKKISLAAVLDARFVREAIEADIVKLAAAAAEPGVVADLREQLLLQTKAARGDAVRFVELDERFHRTLAEAAGKTTAWNLLVMLKAQMDRVRHLTAHHFPMQQLVGQHRAIVDAIATGDPAAAEAAMRGHLREILKDIPPIAGSKPEFFEDADALSATSDMPDVVGSNTED